MTKALSYDDVSIISRKISHQPTRNGDTSIEAFGLKLDMPVIASPMPDICEQVMAFELSSLGLLGIIHRFIPIELQIEYYKAAIRERNVYKEFSANSGGLSAKQGYAACAIGVTGDYQNRFKGLWEAGCRIFCLDTANGANAQVGDAIKWIYDNFSATNEKPYIIAGNVATREGFHYLAGYNVDAIRVGIAGGSVCETKTETGIYYPMISSIRECYLAKLDLKHVNAFENLNNRPPKYAKIPLLIADGGIRTPADMCKALIAGADMIMGGNMFAGSKETPGLVRRIDGKLFKEYKGAASFAVQKDFNGDDPDHVEGDETLVPYRGAISKVIKRFKAGLQSSMSYADANNLNEYQLNAELIEI